MEIFGTQQNLVTKIYRGDVNSLSIMLPKNVVALGNSVDIVVRPISGACWKTTYDFAADGVHPTIPFGAEFIGKIYADYVAQLIEAQ